MKRTLLILAACLPLVAQEPAGSKQESIKGVVRKNLAPVSTGMLRVKLPRPVERRLKNGLRVLILENHRVPTVHFDLAVPASTLNDPPGLPGIAEATAYLMRQGTATRTSRQIAEQISEIGAGLNISPETGGRLAHINGNVLSENLDALLELTADVLLRPSFPQEELDNWKKRRLASLQQNRSSEYFLGSERLYDLLYSGDPRAIISPTPESVQKITRQNLIDFYKASYVPGSGLLGVTGDITPNEMVARLEKHIGAWAGGARPDPDLVLKAPIADKKIVLVNRPNSVQTYLMLANRAIDRLSPDYIACMVMNRVLGSGPSSRLFINIREEKGFTYGVYSNFAATKYQNHFLASSSVRTQVTAPALDEFLKEFRRIREEPVPAEELDNARRAIVAGFALGLENQSGVLRQILTQHEYGLPADYWDTYPDKVMATTAEDVQRVARKYVPLDNLQIVAVGDASKIRDLLKKYGPVEEYSAEGKRVD